MLDLFVVASTQRMGFPVLHLSDGVSPLRCRHRSQACSGWKLQRPSLSQTTNRPLVKSQGASVSCKSMFIALLGTCCSCGVGFNLILPV